MCKLSVFIVLMLAIALVCGQGVVREHYNNDGSGAFDFTYARDHFFCSFFSE